MKKVYLKSFLVLLAITIVISCTKELMNVPKDALTIEKAKAWYELQKTIPVMMLKSAKADKKADCTPDWEKAFASNNDELEVVEAPLIAQPHFNFYTKESMDLRNNNKESDYLNSNSRIVIQKNKKTGFRECYIMTIIGDANYLSTKKLQLKNNSYLRKEKDFSGSVLYHDTDGIFVNGWIYNNGKISGVITSSSQDQTIFRLKLTQPIGSPGTSQDCTLYTFWIIYDCRNSVEHLYWQETVTNSWVVCETILGNGLAIPTPTSGGTPGNSTPSVPNPNPNPDTIKTNLDENKCVKAIYNALMSRSTLSNATIGFLGSSSYNLIWNIGPTNNPNALATTAATYDPNDKNVTITIDNIFANQASGLYIAQAMIHEALHSELHRYIKSIGGLSNLNDDNFETLYDAYRNEKVNIGTAQHNTIADLYRDAIISALRDYDAIIGIKNNRDLEEYKALSWAGLTKTTAWVQFCKDSTARSQEYLRTIQFYYDKKEIWEDKTCSTNLAY